MIKINSAVSGMFMQGLHVHIVDNMCTSGIERSAWFAFPH